MRRLVLALFLLAACSDDDPCATPRPGMVCEVAGTGNMGFNRDGLPPAQTDLYLVSEVRRGPDGLVYLMDFNNQRLRVIGKDGTVHTIAGNGFHGFAFPGHAALDSALENPIDFDFLPDGHIVFVSYHDPRVLFIDASGVLQNLAGTGEQGALGNEGDGGPALEAQFIELTGIVVGPDGAVYVSDNMANRVRVIRNGIVTTFAGNGTAGYDGDGKPATQAALDFPTALALDGQGRLYIADNRNHRVRRVATDGTIETVAGTGDKGFAGDGGPATEAQLGGPDGVAVAADGTLYISDRDNFRVRKVGPDGIIDTVAGSGQMGHRGDGGPALAAQFGYVSRVQLDGDRGLLLADQSNSCAREILLGR